MPNPARATWEQLDSTRSHSDALDVRSRDSQKDQSLRERKLSVLKEIWWISARNVLSRNVNNLVSEDDYEYVSIIQILGKYF